MQAVSYEFAINWACHVFRLKWIIDFDSLLIIHLYYYFSKILWCIIFGELEPWAAHLHGQLSNLHVIDGSLQSLPDFEWARRRHAHLHARKITKIQNFQNFRVRNLKFKMILVRYLYRSDTFVTCHICNTDYTVLHVLKKFIHLNGGDRTLIYVPSSFPVQI